MHRFNRETLSQLLKNQEGPCVSIYLELKQPYWSPRNIVRYRRLLKDAEQELLIKFSKLDTFRLLSPIRYFTSLHRDLKDAKTVCFFASNRVQGFFPTNEKVTNTVVVAPSFHIKPIVSFLNPSDAWLGVMVTDQFIELFRGQGKHRETIRRVNREKLSRHKEHCAVSELVSQWVNQHRKFCEMPVFVFGEEQFLEKLSLSGDMSVLSLPSTKNSEDFILNHVTDKLAIENRLKMMSLNESILRHETISDLGQIALALKEDRVDTLAVRVDKTRWGQIDWNTGFVRTSTKGALLDCVLDDLAERALVSHTKLLLCRSVDLAIDVDAVATLKKEHVSVEKRVLNAHWDKFKTFNSQMQMS